MPNEYDPYAVMNPYSADGQRRTGGAQMNGGKGSGTASSTLNAWQQSKGSDPYASFGNLGMAWSGALGRKNLPAAPNFSAPAGGGQMTTYADPRTGSTMTRNPNQRTPYEINAGAPNSFATPFRMPGEGSPAPAGSTRVFGEPAYGNNQGGGSLAGYNPFAQPVASAPMNEPGPGGNPFAQPVSNPWYEQSRASGEQGPAQDFENRPYATPSSLPPPTTRPPMVPSTQPSPGASSGRPPLTPSSQPPPNNFANPFQPDIGYGPGQTPSFAPPGGTMSPIRPITPDIGYGAGQVPAFAPPQSIPNAGAAPQYTPSGQLLGTNGIGRRYSGDYAPSGEQGASGHAVQQYEWKPDPNNPSGKPILTPVSGNGASATATPPTTGTTQTGTGSTTGTYAPPNSSTTFDPNVLPDSNVGKWFDPIMQDTMDKLSRQLRHEGSLTGATNSGGFIPGMTEALAPVANQFAAQKGQLQFQDQQAKAGMLLDKYKFDNTQQLQQWIQQNQNELQKYGIDQNVLLGKYNADSSLQAAGVGAGASMYGADAAANASRNNAMLDYMQGMYGINANSALGQQRLGYDYYNANQQYGLGQQQLGYNYWNSGQQRSYDDMFNQRGYDLGMTGINRDVYGMDQAQQRYLMDLMWRMSPGGQMGGGYFPTSGVFPYGG